MRVAGFWSKGVIGPYSFENAAGNTITVNGERYRAIISDFLGPYLKELEIGMDLNNGHFIVTAGRSNVPYLQRHGR